MRICTLLFFCFSLSLAEGWSTILPDPAFATLLSQFRQNHFIPQRINSQIEQKEALSQKSRAFLFPSLNAQGSLSRSYSEFLDTPPSDGITDYSSVLLKGNYSLTDIVGKGLEYRSTVFDLDAFKLKAKNQYFKAEANLAKLYLKAQTQKSVYSSWLKSEIENQKIDQDLAAKYRSGLFTKREYLQQHKQVLRNKLSILNAKRDLDNTLAQLSELTLVSKETILEGLGDTLSDPQVDFDNNAKTSSIKALELDIKSAESKLSSTLWNFLPQVSLNGQYGYENRGPFSEDWTNTWSVGAMVNLPLFVGGANVATRTLQRIQLRQTEIDLAELKSNTQIQLSYYQEDYNDYLKYWQLRKSENQLSSEIFQESNREFISGLIDYNDWLNARIEFENSSITYWNEKYVLWLKWIQWIETKGPEYNEESYE